MTDTAIILAGGLGTRLREVIGEVPKPLAPVRGRPFIAWQLDLLGAQGITTVVLATGYLAGMFSQTLGNRWQGMQLVHAPEPEPLGTGGAIAHAAGFVPGRDVLVLNGDTYLRIDTADYALQMRQQHAWAGLSLVRVPDTARYGMVTLHESRVETMHEKGSHGPGHINAGWYWLSAAALGGMAAGRAYSFERDILPEWVVRQRLLGYARTSDFIDIGIPEDYEAIQHWTLG